MTASIVSEGVTRTAKFYVPEGSVYNQPTIFLGVPAACPTDEFLVDSGWKTLADERHYYIVLMEAENGAWGDDDKEIAYITALNEGRQLPSLLLRIFLQVLRLRLRRNSRYPGPPEPALPQMLGRVWRCWARQA